MIAQAWQALIPAGSTEERTRALEEFLNTSEGAGWRERAGTWVLQLVPADFLVPKSALRWRPVVREAMQFVFSRLSTRRLAQKIVEQLELPSSTPPERRLMRLIAKMPGLQKVGQVLARNRRLAPSLRTALIELENGMSDVAPEEIQAVIRKRLGDRLERYSVVIDGSILSEASVSAVVRFTWRRNRREREHGVFKVLKPYVPDCFAEDMTLLQELGVYLAGDERDYGFAIDDIKEMLAEVRLLLEHELDFAREQDTLEDARRTYRASIGIRVPRLMRRLSAAQITAMSEESGVKVTDACRRSPIRRERIAQQLIEALIAVPLFSRQPEAVFHGDPHAGNLFYDEPNRELVVFDWALADRLSRDARRRLVILVVMMLLRNRTGVVDAVCALSLGPAPRARREQRIRREVGRFFDRLPPGYEPGTLDAMRLLDGIALQGVRFPAPLFLFRKMLFTLDAVLMDIAGPEVRIDRVVAKEFFARWLASFGFFHAPLEAKDILGMPWKAAVNEARRWRERLFGSRPNGSTSVPRAPKPGRRTKSPSRRRSSRNSAA